MFLGDELMAILEALESGRSYGGAEKQTMEIGVHVLPSFPKDTTDRNRTSPFAFTGNKFEFRMLGSSQSIANTNVVLNTAVADILCEFADELESASDFSKALDSLIKRTIKEHKRIIFNGNGYSDEWQKEAEKRGLSNYKTTVEALPHFVDKKNVALFTKHKVFSETEMHSRLEILLDSYSKTINLEALTLDDIMNRQIIPAVSAYGTKVADAITAKRCALEATDVSIETELLTELSKKNADLYRKVRELEALLPNAGGIDAYEKAVFYSEKIVPAMQDIRVLSDSIEPHMPKDAWPVPTYSEMLFYI